MRTLVAAFFASLAMILSIAETASAQEHGLTGYYHRSTEEGRAIITGPYDYKTIDRRIDFGTANWTWTPFNMEKRFSAYWNGWMFINERRDYIFGVLANGGAEVYIDEIKVVDKFEPAGKQWKSGFIPLDPGYHRVEVIYFNWSGSAGIGLYWDLGTGYEIIPSAKLYPEDAVGPETPWPQPELPETQP